MPQVCSRTAGSPSISTGCFGGYRKSIEAAHRAIVEPILPQVRLACDLGVRHWYDST